MQELSLIRDLIIVLCAAFLGGVISKQLRLPVLVGYLSAGVISGVIASHYISYSVTINHIAQMGVALLLFTLGLEFSLSRIRQLGEVVIFGSLIQVLVTILISVIIFPAIGLDFYTSLFVGSVFSLSSTAVALKTLSDKGELETLHGEMASGWLFMQDLYTLPFIILLPAIGKMIFSGKFGIVPFLSFIESLIISIFAFFILMYAGKKVVPYLFGKIADVKSRELLLIASVLVCFGFAYLFAVLGLSYAIGAFVAGILLSSSSAHHGIFAEVRPLRDLFSTVFFVSLGFMISPVFILSNATTIFALAVLVILTKFIISLCLVLFLGYHSKTATLVGFCLTSIGEFAFVIGLIGLSQNLIDVHTYQIILSVAFISLIFSVPILISGEATYSLLRKLLYGRCSTFVSKFYTIKNVHKNEEIILKDHVVVLGHGRVGKYICRALLLSEIPFVVVDYDHHLVKHLRDSGIYVIYGDPAEIDVLQFAQVKDAKVVIIAYEDRHSQEAVLVNCLSLNPKIKIICRTHHEEDQRKLKSLGAHIVVQPEFEAAVSMTKYLLRLFSTDEEKIKHHITNLQQNHTAAKFTV